MFNFLFQLAPSLFGFFKKYWLPALLLAAITASSLFTWWTTKNYYQAKKVEALQNLIAQHKEQQEEDRDLLFQEADAQTRIKIVYKTITKEVDRVIKETVSNSDCTVSPDYIRLWNTNAETFTKKLAD